MTSTVSRHAKSWNSKFVKLEFHDFSRTHRIIDACLLKNPDGIYAGLAENATFGTLPEKGGVKPVCREKPTCSSTS